MPFLSPLVDRAKAARAAVGTRGYAGPDGLGCTDLAAHPDTKVAIPSGTTIARIRLTRPLLATDKPPCALTDWLQGVLEDNPDVPIPRVRLHAATWMMSSKLAPGGRTPRSTRRNGDGGHHAPLRRPHAHHQEGREGQVLIQPSPP